MANEKPVPQNRTSESPAITNDARPSLVVGLGASAGGIGALTTFFSRVPADCNLAFIVIMHMSPEHESRLAEILQHHAAIPVTQVRERQKIKPNHVYVIPPNRNLAMIDGHVGPTEVLGPKERRSPIDLFLRTLAETTEERAVAVVLSGTGADGSVGLKRIKEFGGVTFAEDPDEAEYTDMPENAIATGLVDYVLPAAEIPAKILSYRDQFRPGQTPDEEKSPKTNDEALIDIFTLLRVRTGQDFSNYKRATILRRLERRLRLLELASLHDYTKFIRERPAEIHALMKDLLISVTNFFRDPEALEALRLRVLTKLGERKRPSAPVRIWVPGCATGEEAYTLAMLLTESTSGRDLPPADLQIFATDLDDRAIETARRGFYKEPEVADVSAGRLEKFFIREEDGFRVERELREQILFAVHNVIKDPPFSNVDLISCRNLLIYLNRTAQARLLGLLHFALSPDGYLFLGTSESTDGAGDLFSVVDKAHHIFQARSVSERLFPIPEISFRQTSTAPLERAKTPEEIRAVQRISLAALHQRLLETYAAPSLVVNEDYDVVHLSAQAGRYLELMGGEPSFNLLKVVRPDLRIDLRSALYQASRDCVKVETGAVKVSTDQGLEVVNIVVRPVSGERDGAGNFILVLFEPVDETDRLRPVPAAPISLRATQLDDELVQLKAELRATVEQFEVQQEELRASNEELQALNEELRSSAEELETSKEELQSLNEELTTVNQELKIKIEELSEANSNFQNLMNSTNIGTIFLSRELRVRQFTPSARHMFNLIPADIGRPLMDITSKLNHENIHEDIDTVISGLQTIEREVKATDGKTYIARLSPYRTINDKIDGVVITFIDVTDRAHADQLVRRIGEALEIKVLDRTQELAEANDALKREVLERRVVEEARLHLLGQIMGAQEDERRRFARDLHDQLGQQLTTLRLKLDSLRVAGRQRELVAAIDELQEMVKRLDDDVDFLAWELRPVALDELGLEAALKNYADEWSQHFNVTVNMHVNLNERVAPHIESNFYRIAQEALNNCGKHSKCTQVDVILERSVRDDNVVLIVEDNGIGFDSERERDAMRQLGLVGMRERVSLLGGRFEIESKPGEGTTVLIRVPSNHASASPAPNSTSSYH